MPWSSRCSATVSGVAMSVDLQLDHVVLDSDREGVNGLIGGQRERLARAQVEQRAVARALDRAVALVEPPLSQRAVVVGAAILDRVELAADVEDPDLEGLPLDEPHPAGRKLVRGADGDGLAHCRGA